VNRLSGFDYAEIQFDKAAQVIERARYDELLNETASRTIGNVIVLAHGWNNNIQEVRDLYTGMAAQLRAVHDAQAKALGLPSGDVALIGLLWPSKKFTESALIPGGAAGVGSLVADTALAAHLEDLRSVFDAADADERLARAQQLAPRLADSPAARDDFVDVVRGLLPGKEADPEDTPGQLWELQGREVLDLLAPPVLPGGTALGGGPSGGASPAGRAAGGATSSGGPYGAAAGTAAALGLPFSGVKAGAQRLLNLCTYYQMKSRAGAVGVAASGILRELREEQPEANLHLVGHSFGGRLVSAATMGTSGGQPLQPRSVTLLQAAFSHYGFASSYDGQHDGFFRKIITDTMVSGPILITHSVHDLAVGIAYPLASRLARQAASWLGDANDRYGGIGRNGAQKTTETIKAELLIPGAPYTLTPGKLHNLKADDVIEGHSDIVRPEVAYAILSAMATAP
jgi:hypothetical protein